MAKNPRTAAVLVRTLNQACRRARKYPGKGPYLAIALRLEQELFLRMEADRLFVRSKVRVLQELGDLTSYPLLTQAVA